MMREVLTRRFGRALKEDPERSRGTWPDLVHWFAVPKSSVPGWLIAAIGSLVFCVICFVIGMVVGKSSRA